MSRLRKDMFGEYIYISKNIYPTTALFYNNNKFIKSEQIEDFDSYVKMIIDMVNNDKNEFNSTIFNYDVHEIILNETGVARFSLHNGAFRYYGKE